MRGFAEETARRSVATAVLLILAAYSSAAQAATFTMFRDPGCSCCLKWAGHAERGILADVDMADMPKIKVGQGVPRTRWSRHTMVVERYVIEGHVAAEASATFRIFS